MSGLPWSDMFLGRSGLSCWARIEEDRLGNEAIPGGGVPLGLLLFPFASFRGAYQARIFDNGFIGPCGSINVRELNETSIEFRSVQTVFSFEEE